MDLETKEVQVGMHWHFNNILLICEHKIPFYLFVSLMSFISIMDLEAKPLDLETKEAEVRVAVTIMLSELLPPFPTATGSVEPASRDPGSQRKNASAKGRASVPLN